MRGPWLPVALALALPAAASAAEIPVDHFTTTSANIREVRIDFPVGSFRVEATDERRVTLDLTAKCKRRNIEKCEDLAEDIHLETDESAGRVRIRVKGYPKFHSGSFSLEGVLRVPRNVALQVEMGVGALRINDVEGDLDVDLGVGDADISTPSRTVRSVEVATGVGDAVVVADGSRVRRRAFISCTADWDEGRGKSTVSLNVGVGDATVRVD